MSAKKTRNLRLVWLLPLLIFVVVGSATLLAWLPRSSSTFSPLPATTVIQSPSTQPKITWSHDSVEVILSPGESTTKDLTITSSQNLTNVVVDPVPEIAPFMTITPSTFSSVAANSPQSVRINFTIAQGATLGTYQGTIHLRIGTQTLPQTLKVSIRTPNAIEMYRSTTAPRIVYSVVASPRSATVGIATVITVVADIGNGDIGSGATIMADGISLLRYSDDDILIAAYGRMYDNGTHGDATPNDGRYTLQVSLADTVPQHTYFTLSVPYRDLLVPVFSQPVYVTTFGVVQSPDQVLQVIATALEQDDMATVRQHVYADRRNSEALQLMETDEDFRLALAHMLRTARPSRNDGSIAIFLSDGSPIRLARIASGSWILVSW